ncbi:MAG: type II toxin-antitoxin system HicA family toxin [Syntrophomonadaceae bacterium]|nr:type II toxin-antitoxin system HicA family toxin [Syntrophomonadaceae bacterium]
MHIRKIYKILLEGGRIFKNAKGSHYPYMHPADSGKITVPYHPGDIAPIIIKSILRQAG